MGKSDPDQPKTADKPGKRKMALVTATMSADPYEHQQAQDIAHRLVNEGPKDLPSKKNRRAKPHHKRIIASLTRRDAVMDKTQAAAMKRIHPHTEVKAVLGDGEKKIWKSADELFPDWVQFLDIIHVRDKLRLAAHLHYKKESSAAKE